MAETKQVNGQQVLDYLARDYDSLLQAMRERIPEKLPEWTDYTSEADFGNVLLEAFAHMGDILSYYQDRIANESFLGTAQSRRSIIDHLQLIGYRLGTAAPASATLTLLFPFKEPKAVTVKKGDAFATASERDRPSIRFEYTGDIDLHIPNPAELGITTIDPSTGQKFYYYGPPPFPGTPEKSIDTPGLPVQEGRFVMNERIGLSNGLANQRFQLAHAGIILRPAGQDQASNNDLIVLVEHGTRIERWYFRETLAFSRPIPLWDQYESEPQKHFTVEIDEKDRATLIFGDGDFGAIPPKNADIKVTYRVGGGVLGNVPAQTITTIANAPELSLAAIKVINAKPATGGAERETISHAVAQAPQVFRSRKRAVTKDDYEALARSFDGVGKVRAEAAGWNCVTLYVAPEGGGYVTDVLKQNLLAFFEDKRPVTTQIEIEDVTYVEIFVVAEIGIEPYYNHDQVVAKVYAAAKDILQFEKVRFGQTIYLSKFYEAIEAIDGVSYTTIKHFSFNPPARDKPFSLSNDGKLELQPDQLPCLPDKKNYQDFEQGIYLLIAKQNGK